MDMARREGFDEMLFYNTSDELCEAAMANVFLVRDGELLTPSLDSGCLAGVTRNMIMRIANARGIGCAEKRLVHADVRKADCIFLTSSIRGPVRVGVFKGRSYEDSPLFDQLRSDWLSKMKEA